MNKKYLYKIAIDIDELNKYFNFIYTRSSNIDIDIYEKHHIIPKSYGGEDNKII